MEISKKIEHLIVDTSAFIKNVPLQEIANNIITEQSVVDEIKCKRQLRRLVVLPYDLTIRDVFPEHVKFVIEFAKKTGDYTSLSATDIKVIALVYQIEKELFGTAHLKDTPTIIKTLPAKSSEPLAHPKAIAGFYTGDDDDDDNEECVEAEDETAMNEDKLTEKNSTTIADKSAKDEESEGYLSEDPDSQELEDDLAAKFGTLKCNVNDFELEGGDENNMDEILAPIEDDSASSDEQGTEESEDSDDGGWITPSNIANAKKLMDSDILSDKPASVACMTTDFAMQNVLMQIGLNVAALDGRVIKQMRTFIFRCAACYRTTSIMTKIFCPNCGTKNLKKVAVSLDDEGNQQIHINYRKRLSARGKKYSLPTPQGGKHASNPILCEDQPMPDQRPSKLARIRNDPMNDDYIAGYAPFMMRDVNSKAAMLGIKQGHGSFKYWMKKNPNECRRKRK